MMELLQNEIVVRDAIPADWERIVAIYNSTVPSRLVTADTEPVTVESRARWFQEHTPEHRPLWVLESMDKSILGWVSFQSFYGRPAYNATVEISIYLDPSARGRGLGKSILDFSIEHARAFGVKTILGFIFSHNEPSLRLFRSAGFEEWANLPNVAVLDGVERGVKILGKRIAS
jgi:L-amino acid N-acyltransferase YncA